MPSLIKNFSIETIAKRDLDVVRLADALDPRTQVFITALPKDNDDDRLVLARRIAEVGLVPILHIAARRLPSRDHLDRLLARLRGEVGAQSALLIGGEDDSPAAFASCLEVIETGLFARHGFGHLHIGGFPEGHPKVGQEAGEAALLAKDKALRAQGIAATVATQFGFEADSILEWLRRMRTMGMQAPVRIGLAGPASLATLVKFALMCGVTRSVKRLTQDSAFTKLLGKTTPEPVLRGLETAQAKDASLDIAGVHLYAFGGIFDTAQWASTLAREPAGA